MPTATKRKAALRPKTSSSSSAAANGKRGSKGEGHIIFVRCNDAEHERYGAKFAESGLRSFSDWVRTTLNASCDKA